MHRPLVPLAAGLTFALGVSVFAATPVVLTSDTFPGTTVDDNLYAVTAATGLISQTGGELVLESRDGVWGSDLVSRNTQPGNVRIRARFRVVDDNFGPSNGERNLGIRYLNNGVAGFGIGANLFTFKDGSEQDQLVLRHAGVWTVLGNTNITPALTIGAHYTLQLDVPTSRNPVTLTLFDNADAQVAQATADFSAAVGLQDPGIFMLGDYLTRQVNCDSIIISDLTSSAVLFQDDFNSGTVIDTTKWLGPSPELVRFVTVGSGVATLNAADPANPVFNTALLPLRAQPASFDLQAVINLRDLTARGGVINPADSVTVRFRESSVNSFYEFAVFPNAGATIDGVATPCAALRRAIDSGNNVYAYLASPEPVTGTGQGNTLVLNLRVAGDQITAFTGPDKTTGLLPTLEATDSTLTSGIINFVSNGPSGIDLDEYTIWEAGTGDMPATPVQTGVNDFSLYR